MAQPRIRVALVAAAVLLLLAFGAWRLRYLDGERASRTARAVTAAAELSPGSQHALTVMTAEFGDSAALAIRRADEWFNGQRIATRLRGASLGFTATLDSVAVFVLERQGSVALHEGQAAFLSRADGVISRRPTWMAALPDSLRPRFDEPVLPLP